jgi:uncharacterized membrane protein
MSLPPIHPALVHLPIAFVLLSVFADFFARITRRQSLRHVGMWSLFAAFLSACVTVAAGYWDLNRVSLTAQTEEYVSFHLKVGWTLLALLAVLSIWRWRIRQQARRVVTKPYLAASWVLFALTMFQGWFGGEMVYTHGAGVAAAGQGTEPVHRAQDRLARILDVFDGSDHAVGAPGTNSTRNTGSEKESK